MKINLWPGIIFGLLGLNVCVVGATVYLAHADRSAAVEPDYYRKALAWDEQRRVEIESAHLGWTARVEPGAAVGPGTPVRVVLAGPDGAPITGAAVEVEAFSNLRAGDRSLMALTERSPGDYQGTFDAGRSGLWQFRVFASRQGDRFAVTQEKNVSASGSGAR